MIPEWIRDSFVGLADFWAAHWPRSMPGPQLLEDARLVAHRGVYDNRRVFENTLQAFRPLVEAGLWGVELDIRWTRDLEPVVTHDADGRRLYDKPVRICEVPLSGLKQQIPVLPTLAEVVEEVGGRLHLMIELKQEPYPDPGRQSRRLREVLAALEPGVDYHLMALEPSLFDQLEGFPACTFVPIAEARIRQYSRLALQKGWGGVAGHFLLVTGSLRRKHHRAGQQVGTGFPASKKALFREINRSVDWIFTDRPLQLQAVLDEELGVRNEE